MTAHIIVGHRNTNCDRVPDFVGETFSDYAQAKKECNELNRAALIGAYGNDVFDPDALSDENIDETVYDACAIDFNVYTSVPPSFIVYSAWDARLLKQQQ